MRLASLVREVVDQRLRPAQRGAATVAGRQLEGGLEREGRMVLLSGRQSGASGEAGRYGRGRYAKVTYVMAGW